MSTLSDLYTNLKTLCSQWFYTKTEVDGEIADAIASIGKPNGWKTVACSNGTSYATLYVNEDIRMCHYRYYRTGYNFTSTSEITLHNGHIPSDYRPPMPTLLTAYNVTLIGGILANGNLTVQTSTTGSKTINLTAVWHY